MELYAIFLWLCEYDVSRSKDVSSRTEVYNYYSSGDEVFELSDETPGILTSVINLSAPVFKGSFPFIEFNDVIRFDFSRHSWQKQEVLKGVSFIGGTLTGGWAFHYVKDRFDTHTNTQHYKIAYAPTVALDHFNNGTLVDHAVFNQTVDEMFHESIARQKQAEIIAGAIPALSGAVGGTVLGLRGVIESDMETSKSGWGRPEDHSYETRWLHSDLKNMAYRYTWNLFDNLVGRGDIK